MGHSIRVCAHTHFRYLSLSWSGIRDSLVLLDFSDDAVGSHCFQNTTCEAGFILEVSAGALMLMKAKK